MKSVLPVILCGGSGTRLWPLSRTTLPKQFLPLISSRTMLQETALLFGKDPGYGGPILVCSYDHRFLAAEQIREIGIDPSVHILEPEGRNTAPAVAVAAFAAMEKNREALLLVLPADLLIENIPAFRIVVATACKLAMTGKLVTFGIAPTYAETGYGYIRRGRKLDGYEGSFEVSQFVNKPDASVARRFLLERHCLWNSGMFVFTASRYLEELAKYHPAILEATHEAWHKSTRDPDFIRLDERAFDGSPSDSIDQAVMEKTGDAVVIESEIGWSDVGSWKGLWQAGRADSSGNVVWGDVGLDSVRNCYVRAESRFIAAVGVENLVIVETPDAVLVRHKDRSQAVGEIVDSLKAMQREEYVLHKRVYRPWGYFEELDAGESFRVMHIMIEPGSRHSFPLLGHCAEHWVVVAGTAEITRGKEVLLLSENESTSIPIGTKGRLKNAGKAPLHIIEVQSGVGIERDKFPSRKTIASDRNWSKAGTRL